MLVEKTVDNYLKNQKKTLKQISEEMEQEKDFYYESYLKE